MEKRCSEYGRTLNWPAGLVAALFCILFGSDIAFAQMARLTWDPNPEPHVAGYNVYRTQQPGVFGTSPLNGSTPITTTSFTDATVQPGKTYYYVVRAKTIDGLESPDSEEVEATIPVANKPPAVSAGPDRTITLPGAVNLAATASDDGLPNGLLTYQWSVVSGSGVQFSNPNSPTTSASMTAAGTYTFRVTVTDGQFSASDDVVVTAKASLTNQPPQLTTNPTVTVTLPNQATLTASASDDGLPSGTLHYTWSVVSGTGVTLSSPASAVTNASFPAPGRYVLRAAVTDGQLSDTSDVVVDVFNDAEMTLYVSKSREVLRGAVTSITGAYEDPRVAKVELFINQSRVLAANSQSFSYRWDLRKLSGRYTIHARALDAQNTLLKERSVTVTVK